jgi:hypothetical protein
MRADKLFLFVLSLFIYHNKLHAQGSDSKLDTAIIKQKTKLIEKKIKKQRLASFRDFEREIDSLHYFVGAIGYKKGTKFIGDIQVAFKINEKQGCRVEYTFFESRLARILILKRHGGGVFYYENDILFSGLQKNSVFQPDELFSLAYLYYDIALHYLENPHK